MASCSGVPSSAALRLSKDEQEREDAAAGDLARLACLWSA